MIMSYNLNQKGLTMKNIILTIIILLTVSGCVTGTKAVKPSSGRAINIIPSIENENVSKTPALDFTLVLI